ncbi:hypothetical protein DEU56DRAFT_759899 [Suillus clintonianus]|uniref:uncharacterized protein n=1 Tax=Suillus clintonianus TaxID=1904413 RepID=UPI001B873531|nr:uncharacterized protein DEU56DRAFT_759899 [Suillus clintonianus]KAG2123870.1 hypothetical protein DEU56DRAFT_759899 [Suillus clintonianus]
MIGQVLKGQGFFVRQWAWCIWRSGDGLALEVLPKGKHERNFLSTILNGMEDDGPSFEILGIFYETVTKDDGPSFETPGIFYEVHLKVRKWSGLEVPCCGEHTNNFIPTILKVIEDDGPSFERPDIFWVVLTPEGIEDDGPSFETPGIFYEMMMHQVSKDKEFFVMWLQKMMDQVSKGQEFLQGDDGQSFKTLGNFCEVVGLVHLEVFEDDGPSFKRLGIFYDMGVVLTGGPMLKLPNNILPTIMRATKDDKPSFKMPGWSGTGCPTLKKT